MKPSRSNPAWLVRRALFFAVFALSGPAFAQNVDGDNELQIRLGATVKKDLSKRWSVKASPEIRTAEWDPDRYLLELAARYEPLKYLDLQASLRGDLNESKDGLGYGLRPGFSATGILPIDDFRFEARLLYTFDFGYLRDEEHRLRYRGGVKYNVPGIRLYIELGVEAFQVLNDPYWLKMRYALELSYKFYKSKKLDQFIYAGYLFDYYLDQPLNTHIPSFGYKLHL